MQNTGLIQTLLWWRVPSARWPWIIVAWGFNWSF